MATGRPPCVWAGSDRIRESRAYHARHEEAAEVTPPRWGVFTLRKKAERLPCEPDVNDDGQTTGRARAIVKSR